MKRVLQFEATDTGFACFENNVNVFEIPKSTLQFDVKKFYQAFYGEGKDYEDIEVANNSPDDKDARRVYQCIIKLVTLINDKLQEMSDEDKENVCRDNLDV